MEMQRTTEQEDKSYIIKTEVKRLLKDLDHQTAGDFVDALNKRIIDMIRAAGMRARENGRKQVRACDL